jgi:sigma-E factor negative regulatory protein RseB
MARVADVSLALPLIRFRPRCLAQTLALLGLALASASFAAADVAQTMPPDSTAARLGRMAQAVDGLNYEGTLVYLADNRMETLHLVHRVDGDRIDERLISLSGPVRAVARQGQEVTCSLSGDQPISVKRHPELSALLRHPAIDPDAVADHYLVHPLGEVRVAGRDTDVIGIIPRDHYRFGYRFYLDRATGLPLKSDLMGPQGDPSEQVMFTAIEVGSGSGLPPAEAGPLQPPPGGLPGDGGAGAAQGPSDPALAATGPWRFRDLPPGFAVRTQARLPEGGAEPVEHFVVTDRLASVSVFVEGRADGGLVGATRIGGIHALGGRIDGHQVTVVGQVPAATLEAVLAAVYRDPGGQP